MADYIVTDTELTNVANSIRNKCSTTATLNYPNGFITALNDIEVGYDTYGFIDVTYPAGSTCTAISSDGVELTAPDTSGSWIIKVPEPMLLEATWTISCNDGTIINSDNEEVIINNEIRRLEVELSYIPTILNDVSWELISQIAQAGAGDWYWDIGDYKEIVLNGKIGNYLTLTNYTTYIFILDFNYLSDNNIIFGGFKDISTNSIIDIALCDSDYMLGYYNNRKNFNINHYGSSGGYYNTNYGGWKGCDFRYDILGATSTPPKYYGTTYKTSNNTGYDATQTTITSPIANTLMAALPNDFRNILKLWQRYSTIDAGISLLSEFEIFGTRTNSSYYETLVYTEQIEYYNNGNSKIRYKHNSLSNAISWWTSSPSLGYSGFVDINSSGNTGSSIVNYALGLAPIFKV